MTLYVAHILSGERDQTIMQLRQKCVHFELDNHHPERILLIPEVGQTKNVLATPGVTFKAVLDHDQSTF